MFFRPLRELDPYLSQQPTLSEILNYCRYLASKIPTCKLGLTKLDTSFRFRSRFSAKLEVHTAGLANVQSIPATPARLQYTHRPYLPVQFPRSGRIQTTARVLPHLPGVQFINALPHKLRTHLGNMAIFTLLRKLSIPSAQH